MELELLAIILAALGIAVPGFAFLWEFFLVRRKQLGYRVQMDTAAIDETHSKHAGILARMLRDSSTSLVKPTFVLVRIENDGVTTIDESDYQVVSDIRVGVRIVFPGRTVAGMVVTELSNPNLGNSFGDVGSGDIVNRMGEISGTIDLPRVPLNRNDHYKVLAVLERVDGKDGDPAAPKVEAGIKGGRVKETTARTGVPQRATALIAFMAVVIVGLGLFTVFRQESPLDCAEGTLKLTGSTAFAPAMRGAGELYARTCSDVAFIYDFQGSSSGLNTLQKAGDQAKGSPDVLTFSDGAKPDVQPRLLPRPIAFMLFTIVANKDAGVEDLTLEQVKRLYKGEIESWKEIGGNDVPVSLVSRKPGSGTRTTFQQQFLQGKREAATNSDDCKTLDKGGEPGILRCERDSTDDLLDAVASTSGGLGYAELGAAIRRPEVAAVRIDGQKATLDAAAEGAYPFWETEFAYTYQEPNAQSLAASFLRYLTNQVGKDIIRSHGNRPCDELENSVLCRPGRVPFDPRDAFAGPS